MHSINEPTSLSVLFVWIRHGSWWNITSIHCIHNCKGLKDYIIQPWWALASCNEISLVCHLIQSVIKNPLSRETIFSLAASVAPIEFDNNESLFNQSSINPQQSITPSIHQFHCLRFAYRLNLLLVYAVSCIMCLFDINVMIWLLDLESGWSSDRLISLTIWLSDLHAN